MHDSQIIPSTAYMAVLIVTPLERFDWHGALTGKRSP